MKVAIGAYDYSGLIKSYLAQDRKQARTAGGRLSYIGKSIYSYQTTLGALITHKNQTILLVNRKLIGRSNTTTRQMHLLLNYSSYPTFIVAPSSNQEYQLHSLIDTATNTFNKMQRARSRKPMLATQFLNEFRKATEFAELFDLQNDEQLEQLLSKQFIALANKD